MKFSNWIMNIVNAKAGGMCLSFFLAVAGISMIFAGIRDSGSINVKTPFIDGRAESGFVGLLLVFGSVIIAVCSILMPRGKHSVSIQEGTRVVRWEGTLGNNQEHEFIKELVNRLTKGTTDDGEQQGGGYSPPATRSSKPTP